MNTTSRNSVLQGLKVVDLSQLLAGPYCTMILADLGADVVKVERPVRGEDARHIGKVFLADQLPALFAGIQRNKRSLALDFKVAEGREILGWLVDTADVLVENFRPGTLEALGLGWTEMRARNPKLVYAKISGYGIGGPFGDRAGIDSIIQAESGLMSATGEPHGPPVMMPLSVVDCTTGIVAALGVTAALLERSVSGQGQRVDMNLLDTAIAWSAGYVTAYYADGSYPKRTGTASDLGAPAQAFAAREGNLVFGAFSEDMFRRCCEALGSPELAAREEYATTHSRLKHKDRLARDIESILQARTADEWVDRLKERGVPASRIKTLGEGYEHPQVLYNGMIAEQDHPAAGRIKLPMVPIHFSETPTTVRSPAPLVGEHSRMILKEWLHIGDPDFDELRRKAAVWEPDHE